MARHAALLAADGTAVPGQLTVGTGLQLAAVPTYTDGTTGKPTTDAEWTLTPAGNGTIPKGLLTLTKPGDATVTATLANPDGTKVTSSPVTISGIAPGTTIYYGASAANVDAIDETLIKTLTARTTTGDAKGSYEVDAAGDGDYILFALPAAFKTPTFSVGGFDGGFAKAKTTSVDGTPYDVWRSDNPGLGALTLTVK